MTLHVSIIIVNILSPLGYVQLLLPWFLLVKAQVEPSRVGLHDDGAGVGDLSELEFLVQVDVEIAYWTKLTHIVKYREWLLMLLFPLASWGIIWF